MPASPSPAKRIRVESSTPAGMLTDSTRSRVTRPLPEHTWQGFCIISPRPEQVMQVRSMVKNPWLARTLPKPWQVGHVMGLEPASAPAPPQASQVTEAGTRICAALPVNASTREISMLYLRSEPRSLALLPRERRPPMNSPKRSSKISDIEAEKSAPKPYPAPLAAPCSKAAWPN